MVVLEDDNNALEQCMVKISVLGLISVTMALLLSACGKDDTRVTPVAGSPPPFAPAEIALLPQPVSLEAAEGRFVFSRESVLLLSHPELQSLADYWNQETEPATGFALPVHFQHDAGADTLPSAQLQLQLVASEKLGSDNPEAYRLVVTREKVVITASHKAGMFYGLQTLRQLLPAKVESPTPVNNQSWFVPAVTIVDEPLYPYRGMHLDVARHYQPVWFIKRYIDLLALHKMNRFHWHLTDDQGWRLPIAKYPLLTEKGAWRATTVVGHTLDREHLYDNQPSGGFYTREQIRDIVDYAAARQITVIPEIDIPGHASAVLNAYPEFGCSGKPAQVQPNFGIFPAVLCPTEPTFEFLQAVFTDVAELFPGDFIHVGGDEVLKDEWQQSEFCQQLMAREGLEDYHQLQSYFIRRVSDIVTGLDKKLIGWNEILDGGVADNAIIMSWQGIEGGIAAARMGHDAIMTPFAYTYFDFFQSRSVDEPMAIHGLSTLAKVYSYNPMPEELAGTDQARHILGAQGQVWTEYLSSPREVEYMVLPRMSALAEIVWTPRAEQSWQSFTRRLPKQFERFDAMGVNASRSVFVAESEATTTGKGEDATVAVNLQWHSDQVVLRYTTDGNQPNAQSENYRQPLVLTGNQLLRARAQDVLSGEMYGETVLRTQMHKGVNRPVRFSPQPSTSWNTQPHQSLLDGVLKTDQLFQPDDWVTFYSGHVEISVDLEQSTPVSQVSFGFDPGLHRQMFPPTGVEVQVSDDGRDWRTVTRLEQPALDAMQSRVVLPFEPQNTRWLRLVAENQRKVLDTQTEKETSVPLYFDELVIE